MNSKNCRKKAIPIRTRYDRQATEQRILSTCVKLFLEQGFSNTPPKQIFEEADVSAARRARAGEEAEGIESYDYLVVNDTIERASELLNTLITNEREGQEEKNDAYRVSANMDLIRQIREELKEYSKGE